MKKRLIMKLEKKYWLNFFSVGLLFLSLIFLPKFKVDLRNDSVAIPLTKILFIYDLNNWENSCEKSSRLCLELKKNITVDSQRLFFYEKILINHPMQEMAKNLAEIDSQVADYLVAIAKKESNWGKYSPQKNGRTCYNYWGYRGIYNQTKSGYSCFDSKEQAIEIVGKRIEDLLAKGVDTPEEMLVWKCGSNCRGHDLKDVAKWVSDVKMVLKSLKS